MTDLIIPDVSEYQGTIDWAKLAAACPAVIIRLHNGWRLDHYGPANRVGAHAHGCRAVGLYQYLPAAVDPATAAHEFCDAIGSLDPGEWPILDIEEGAGDQSGRARTWYATVAGRLHDASSEELYSGEYFYGAHRLSAAGFSRIWLAAYGSGEPGAAHELWQFTDSRAFPGVSGVTDASVFHGTITDLLAHITPGGTPVALDPAELQLLKDVHKAVSEPSIQSRVDGRFHTLGDHTAATNAMVAELVQREGALMAAVQALAKLTGAGVDTAAVVKAVQDAIAAAVVKVDVAVTGPTPPAPGGKA